MTRIQFLDITTMEVITRNNEIHILKSYIPVHYTQQQQLANSLASYFDEESSKDKSDMIYWVLMKTIANDAFSFYYDDSENKVERERVGARIKNIRESKGMEAKQLALLANIDASNLCRIEQGKYSVGLDILTKISNVLGVTVDLVKTKTIK